jgi:predicted Fe-Mo cluster-binding NifX family protein
MKIAVSSTGPNLDSEVDPRFGRCQYFLIVDLDDMGFEAVANGSMGQQGGAGIQSAKVVAEKGVKAVLTGNVGPNAYQVLSEVGVDVITGVSGTVREAARQYKEGRLGPARKANVADHFGMGTLQSGSPSGANPQAPVTGWGTGRGMGCGRRMGGGRGTGCGRGAGRGQLVSSAKASLGGGTGKEELVDLKEHARQLREQMADIQMRIKVLEKDEP